MKHKFWIVLVASALSLSSPVGVVKAEGVHHHAHGPSEPTRLQLNAGKKWATDEPLRQAMNGINEAMAKALPEIHRNRFANPDYQALAGTVNDKVAYAVANCKLEARADAMLHLVIADLTAGAEIMEGKTSQARHDGALKVLDALRAYGKHFQHPGWKVARG